MKISMVSRLLTAVVAVALCASAQTTLTVAQLMAFIKSSIELKQPDRQVAAYLSKCKMSERLDDRTIEEMQGEGGLGQRTLEALKQLRDASESLPKAQPKPPAPKPVPIPPPSSAEQGRILDKVRDKALNYTKSLPDFICTQVTRRFFDPTGRAADNAWQSADILTARLSYFEQKEEYKLILINNRLTDQNYNSIGGASSTGEFGSMLREIFERRSEARFEWSRWATLRGRRTYVFSYHIAQSNSQYHISYERKQDIVAAYHGEIFVERETHMVLRITADAEDIPPSFPVQATHTMLDYDYSKIGDSDFLLPLRAEVRMRGSDRLATKNDVEFHMYRKFSAEASVKFDVDSTPAPLPESQTKEQPPK